MGCFGSVRASLPSGRAAGQPALADVVVTQTHSVRDPGAAAMVRWLCEACHHGGVNSFFEEGLSSSLSIQGARRRRLRDAFEVARCVVAAAVGDVTALAAAPPPLTNEVLWAEQHKKPIVLLYDDARPFDRRGWELRYPFFFREKGSQLVRFYGRGHEACRAELLRALGTVGGGNEDAARTADNISGTRGRGGVGGDEDRPGNAGPRAAAAVVPPWAGRSNRSSWSRGSGGTEFAEMHAVNDCGMPHHAAAVDDGRPRAWEEVDLALGVLRRAGNTQPQPLEQRTKQGIIRRPADTKSRTTPCSFLPAEDDVQEAARTVSAWLRSRAAPPHLVVQGLEAANGVSEEVVAAAIRSLVETLDVAPTGEAEAALAKYAAQLTLVALKRHRDSVDVCTSALEALQSLWPLLATPPNTFPSPAEAELILGAMRSFPGCVALQLHGLVLCLSCLEGICGSALALCDAASNLADREEPVLALRGGGLARVLTRAGLPILALEAIRRHPAEPDMVLYACEVLQRLSDVSREVKMQVVAADAMRSWAALLHDAPPRDAAGAGVAVRLLMHLTASDARAKDACGELASFWVALERYLSSREEHATQVEVFGLLCSLTARHAKNKERCMQTGLMELATGSCLAWDAPDALRVAAAGLLVNLCGDADGRRRALEAGASKVVESLLSSNGSLQRCGKALQQLLFGEGAQLALTATDVAARTQSPHGSMPSRELTDDLENPFEKLFSRRASAAASPVCNSLTSGTGLEYQRNESVEDLKQRSGKEAAPTQESAASTKRKQSKCKEARSGTTAAERPSVRSRGPGWQRKPKTWNERLGPGTEVEVEGLDGDEGADNFMTEWAPSAPATRDSLHDGLSTNTKPPKALADEARDPDMMPSPRPLPRPSPRDLDFSEASSEDSESARTTLKPSHGLKGTVVMRAQLQEIRDAEAAAAAKRRRGFFGGRRSAAP